MKFNRITLEQGIFILALLLAILIRAINLNSAALSEYEAEQAVEALQISEGEDAALTAGPAYPLLTGAVFYIFSANNLFARFWPAVAGISLLGLALILRSKAGMLAALVFSLGLALDPGLVAVSRLAGGPMLAAGFGLLALGFILIKRPAHTGICAALAALSGPAALHGLSHILLASGIGFYLVKRGSLIPFSVDNETPTASSGYGIGLVSGGAAVLVAGTLFFKVPEGLGAAAGIIPVYIAGWFDPPTVPAARLLAALLVYQPLGIVLAAAASVHAWRRKSTFMQWVSIWAISALAMVLVYPARQESDLIWVLVPVWLLAAWEIASHIRIDDIDQLPAAGQATLILILFALGWLNLAGLGTLGGDSQSFRLRWMIIGGMLFLAGITFLLVGLGWSYKTARRGLVWGLLVALGVYTLSNLGGIVFERSNGEQDLWNPAPVIRQADELLATLNTLSVLNTGMQNSLDVVVTSSEASLRWALRDWSRTKFLTGAVPGEDPTIIINTEGQAAPGLAVSYRGQDFAWWVSPAWGGALPEDWARWVVFRTSPEQVKHIILWARVDAFPGGVANQPAGEGESTLEDSP